MSDWSELVIIDTSEDVIQDPITLTIQYDEAFAGWWGDGGKYGYQAEPVKDVAGYIIASDDYIDLSPDQLTWDQIVDRFTYDKDRPSPHTRLIDIYIGDMWSNWEAEGLQESIGNIKRHKGVNR